MTNKVKTFPGVSPNFDAPPPRTSSRNTKRPKPDTFDLDGDAPPAAETEPPPSTGLIPMVSGSARIAAEQKSIGVPQIIGNHTRLSSQMSEIVKLLDDGVQDGAISAINKSMLVSILDLLPVAIDKYKSTGLEFHAYALGALVTQIRGLITDLQSGRDRAMIAERINTIHLKSAFLLIIQQVADQTITLKAFLAGKVLPHHEKEVGGELDSNIRALSRYMNEVYDETSDKIRQVLVD